MLKHIKFVTLIMCSLLNVSYATMKFLKCWSLRINKNVVHHTTEFYSAITRSRLLTWVNLRGILLSERSKIQKTTAHTVSLTRNVRKGKTTMANMFPTKREQQAPDLPSCQKQNNKSETKQKPQTDKIYETAVS